jgi:integrase
MATIRKYRRRDGRMTYNAQVRMTGHPPQTATFRLKADAERWAEKIENAIRDGKHIDVIEARRHSVAELIDRYMLDELPRMRTAYDRRLQLEWWKERIGDRSLAQVTPALLVEHKHELRRGRAAGTVNRYLAALSHVFSIGAKEYQWVRENPVRSVRKLPEPRGVVRFLSDDERSALINACRANSCALLYPLVLVALSTGARQGELLALRWPDIDLARGRATVHESKNDERRSLTLAGEALTALRDLSRLRRIDTDLVFPNPRGAGPLSLREPWVAALREAKIQAFRFHDLRHTTASYLAMSGATTQEIAAVLGHKTLAMVKRYAHLTEQHTADVVERMNRKFLGGTTS